MSKAISALCKGCKSVAKVIGQLFDFAFHLLTVLRTVLKSRRTKFSKVKGTDKILIMGNAPSLNDTDVKAIVSEGAQVVCVNYYPVKNPDFYEIKPEYLCIVDPGFFTESDEFEDLWNALSKVDWKINIICPQGYRMPVNNPYFEYIWINNNTHRSPFGRFYWYRKNLSNPGMQNVVLAALYYFTSVGTEKIYLAGVEMGEFSRLHVDEKNEIYVYVTHSYGNDTEKMSEATNIKQGEMYVALEFYQKMFEQFKELADYAIHECVKIYNLTPKSYLDVFEKNLKYWKGDK